MKPRDYWEESIAIAAEECDLKITPEQLTYMAEAMEGSHDNYGMAFYSPPASDRRNDVERGWKAKYADLEAKLERYERGAERAIKTALRLNSDANVSIGEDGGVTRWGGRSERIL